MTIKVKNPQKGDWSVSVAGDAEDSIKINLLTTFDMNLTLDIGSSSPKTGDDITLTALLKCGDQTITDDDLLYGATGTCIIKKAGEKKAQKIPMDADSYRFKYTMKAEKPGDYETFLQKLEQQGHLEKKKIFHWKNLQLMIKQQRSIVRSKMKTKRTHRFLMIRTPKHSILFH